MRPFGSAAYDFARLMEAMERGLALARAFPKAAEPEPPDPSQVEPPAPMTRQQRRYAERQAAKKAQRK